MTSFFRIWVEEISFQLKVSLMLCIWNDRKLLAFQWTPLKEIPALCIFRNVFLAVVSISFSLLAEVFYHEAYNTGITIQKKHVT